MKIRPEYPIRMSECRHGVGRWLMGGGEIRHDCPDCTAAVEAEIQRCGGLLPDRGLWWCDRHSEPINTVKCPECLDEQERDEFLAGLPGRLEDMVMDQPHFNERTGDIEVVPVDHKKLDALISEAKRIGGVE